MRVRRDEAGVADAARLAAERPGTSGEAPPEERLDGGFFEDRYTDLCEIGRGASSVVYRAFSPAFSRDVAVKVFEGGIADDDLRRRFRRECKVLGTLADHPHVVSVFDSGFTRTGRPYIVMAYCAGGSFGQRVAGQGPRPAVEAAVVGIAIADALDAAHARGVVHRDVKPQNVLLTGYGVVALADFGVASGPLLDLRSFAATPGYVAPEVVLGPGRGGAPGDIYALGATLYGLLTGGPPLRPKLAEAEVDYLFRCAEEPAPPLPPTVPPALARVVHACLEKAPEDRPADAATLRRLLRLAAVEDGLVLPERLEPLPVPAAVAAGASIAGRVATPAATDGARMWALPWPRRFAIACLAGGLVAAGIAGGAWLAPGGVSQVITVPGLSDGERDPGSGEGEIARQQPEIGTGTATTSSEPEASGERNSRKAATNPGEGGAVAVLPTSPVTSAPTIGPGTPPSEPPAVTTVPTATGSSGSGGGDDEVEANDGPGKGKGKDKPPKPKTSAD